MSDGPHRSLKMRSWWKRVAEFADNEAFSPEDISSAVVPALSQDWRLDVPESVSEGICEVLGPAQESFFQEDKVSRLDSLRPKSAGYGLGQVLIDCAVKSAAEGKSGAEAPVEAASNALSIWGIRHVRQIEEHYHRNSSTPRAKSVRAKTEEGLLIVSVRRLARQLLGLDQHSAPRKAPKQSGLDDGVKL